MKNSSKQPYSIAKLWSLSWRKKWLFIRVFAVLTTYKGLLIYFPFKRFMKSSRASYSQERVMSESQIYELIWAVKVISSHIPLGFTCLTQALSTKWLLKNQADVALHIGVRKRIDEGFSAHAWISYQNKTVLGEQANNETFEPILVWS